jgi:hypothetical protein
LVSAATVQPDKDLQQYTELSFSLTAKDGRSLNLSLNVGGCYIQKYENSWLMQFRSVSV